MKSEGLPGNGFRLIQDQPMHMSADGRVIVSGQMVVDSWGYFPYERTLVYDRFTRSLDVQRGAIRIRNINPWR
jgi:hypothetical protein